MDNAPLPTNTFYDLAQDSQGNLWLGARNALIKWDGSTFSTFVDDNPRSYFQVNVGPDDIIWLRPSNANVKSFDGVNFTGYDDFYTFFDHPDAIAVSADGTVWTGEK